jgi:hypothetical protein
MLNVGRISDLIELYALSAGVAKDRINPVLIREIINLKLREFLSETSVLESSSTIDSVADQQEYELPEDCLNVKHVKVDGYRAYKINHNQVDEIAGNLS